MVTSGKSVSSTQTDALTMIAATGDQETATSQFMESRTSWRDGGVTLWRIKLWSLEGYPY